MQRILEANSLRYLFEFVVSHDLFLDYDHINTRMKSFY